MERKGTLTKEAKTPLRYKCVVVGASAGGVEALTSFFQNLPITPGQSYVVALHISSKFPSALTDIIGRVAKMPTLTLQDRTRLKEGHVYIIPPGVDIELSDGEVVFTKTVRDNRPHPDISKLFESFAAHYGRHMIAIVLSGTGSDGSMGAQVVKNFGGTVLAQDSESSKYTSMPENVLNTGVVDFALSPEDLAEKVVELSKIDDENKEEDFGEAIDRIIKIVRLSKGYDFSLYKSGTIRRRISHRMQSAGISSVNDYITLLRSSSREVDELVRSMLISVTEFFRDKEVFAKLRQLIADRIAKKPKASQFRAWVAGCATGEEAYTLGMILKEILPSQVNLRIFATDIDQRAIEQARAGTYPKSQLKQIPAQYHQYLKMGTNDFTILPSIRDTILFSVHDILRDPPLIRQDLVSCRNLLIYLVNRAQSRVAKNLAYALNENGLLLLGNSESLEDSTYFKTLATKEKILRLHHRPTLEVVTESMRLGSLALVPPEERKLNTARKIESESRIEKYLAGAFAPPSFVVTSKFIVTEVFGDLRPYLDLKPGVLLQSIEHLFARDMALFLKSCMIQIKKEATPRTFSTRLKLVTGKDHMVEVRVQPFDHDGPTPSFLFSFLRLDDLSSQERSKAPKSRTKGADEMVEQLHAENEALRIQLKNAIEDLESTNEELQSMNEELQASNEELQSSNEELESTNEELRATNEELLVVNDQLRVKSNELDDFYSSLQLIEDTIDSSIVLVDHSFRILRCNLAARTVFRLDRGLTVDAMFSNLQPAESAVGLLSSVRQRKNYSVILTQEDRTYRVSFLPALKARSDAHWGLLVATDITDLEQSRLHAATGAMRFSAVLNSMDASIALLSQTGDIIEVNSKWKDFGRLNGIDVGYDPIGKNYLDVCKKAAASGVDGALQLVDGINLVLAGKVPRFSLQYPCHSRKEKRFFLALVTPLIKSGRVDGCVVTHVDVSEREDWKRRFEDLKKTSGKR